MLDIENIGITVGIVLLSCVQAEIDIISYLLPVPDRNLCTNIRPTMLFDAKDMRIPLKFHIYSICNVSFKCFRFHVCHFDFRLNSERIMHRVMLLSAAVTSASSKTNAATLNLLLKIRDGVN